MKEIYAWADEDIPELADTDPADVTLLVRDLHGLLTALERYEIAIDQIEEHAAEGFANPKRIVERCDAAREELDLAIDFLMSPPDEEESIEYAPDYEDQVASSEQSVEGNGQGADVDESDTDAESQSPAGESAVPDTIIRNLLENPVVALQGLNMDQGLQPPAADIGQLYRTELEVTDPDAAELIYDNAMIMAGSVQIVLDTLESFAEYHPTGGW